MMHTLTYMPMYSEHRHLNSPYHKQWFQPYTEQSPCKIQWHQPYIMQEHVTTTSQRSYQSPFIINPNRPHINVKLNNRHHVRALVDSGSTICLGDSSLIKYMDDKAPNAPPINVTNVHSGRRQTIGCYNSMLSVTDKLPHPVVNKNINIHMQDNLSSELVLGADFLAENGAVINFRENNVIFVPNELFPVSLSQKPIVC